MRIQPIQAIYSQAKSNFKGENKFLTIRTKDYYGNEIEREEKNLSKFKDYTEDIKAAERERGNIKVERTIGSFHTEPTNLIYYASPLEIVSDRDRVNADYIVHDLEPKLPKAEGEVSENYFGTHRINYGDEYKKVQDYFYRLEMDSQGQAKNIEYRMYAGIAVDDGQKRLDELRGRIQHCKDMQRNIQKARDIYHSADWARGTKEHNENLIDQAIDKLAYEATSLDVSKEDLKYNRQLEKNSIFQINLLKSKLSNYQKSQEINKRLNPSNLLDSPELLNDNINGLKFKIQQLERELVTIKDKIKENRLQIIRYPQRVAAIRNNVKEYLQNINKVKADLIPMFDRLKEHCIKHGIRG